MTGGASGWYLLVHQVPPDPIYLRARVRNRLDGAGAIALKNSVYVLPRREHALENFQGIAEEVVAGGGEAWVCEAAFVAGGVDAELVDRFNAARNGDFEEFSRRLREHRWSADRPGDDRTAASGLARLRRRFSEIAKIDFFGAPGRADAERLLRDAETAPASGRGARAGRAARPAGRTGVTRRGVQVDRIASAWLIRRFVDPQARFRFADPKGEDAAPGEIRFDMVGGDFTHEDDRCTFETLVRRFALPGAALAAVAEIVHDVDLKDGKFGRAEAAGIEQLVRGIVAANADDPARLDRGFALFDDLHRSFERLRPERAAERKRRGGSS